MSKYPTEQGRLSELKQKLEGMLQFVKSARMNSRTPWKTTYQLAVEAQQDLASVEVMLAECAGMPLDRCGARSNFGYVCDLPRHEGNDHAGEAPVPGNRVRWHTR